MRTPGERVGDFRPLEGSNPSPSAGKRSFSLVPRERSECWGGRYRSGEAAGVGGRSQHAEGRPTGGMTERPKVAVLKTAEPRQGFRGFESHSLRSNYGDVRGAPRICLIPNWQRLIGRLLFASSQGSGQHDQPDRHQHDRADDLSTDIHECAEGNEQEDSRPDPVPRLGIGRIRSLPVEVQDQ